MLSVVVDDEEDDDESLFGGGLFRDATTALTRDSEVIDIKTALKAIWDGRWHPTEFEAGLPTAPKTICELIRSCCQLNDNQMTNQNNNNNNNTSSKEAPSSSSSVNKVKVQWDGPSDEDLIKHCEFIWRSNIYSAYQRIEDLFKPFTSSSPDANFQVSLYLINTLAAGPFAGLPQHLQSLHQTTSGSMNVSMSNMSTESWLPHGVSMSRILQALTKSSVQLGAFKLARHAFERLRALLIPEIDRDTLELAMLTVQSKPIRDDSTLLPVCFLTGQSQPLLNPLGTGDTAGACGHLFIRSMINYEVLPLVEFVPVDGLSDEEVIELIRTPPPSSSSSSSDGRKRGSWGEDERHGGNDGNVDLFHQAINNALSLEEGHDGSESKGGGGNHHHTNNNGMNDKKKYHPIVCDASCLLSLKRSEVYCLRPRLELALEEPSNESENQSQTQPGQSNSHSMNQKNVNGKHQESQYDITPSTLIDYNHQMNSSLGRSVKHCRFFKNMLGSDAPVAQSQTAGSFFMEEDLELILLKEGLCPISRVKTNNMKDYGAL
mmetsp:Transcript_43941/g.56327  ORF Transcript_43941/g.56327 Transcript_43941/m.56327 type:complete len:546 (-) Transcript_43941:310-1947(-)